MHIFVCACCARFFASDGEIGILEFMSDIVITGKYKLSCFIYHVDVYPRCTRFENGPCHCFLGKLSLTQCRKMKMTSFTFCDHLVGMYQKLERQFCICIKGASLCVLIRFYECFRPESSRNISTRARVKATAVQITRS
jgi:hypothetical protein